MKRISILFAGVISVLLISCGSSPKEDKDSSSANSLSANPSSQEQSIFTTDWQENKISDALKCGYFYTTPELGKFSKIEGEFKKAGGYENSAFGFVFSYIADDKGYISNYLRFEITTSGKYAVYSCSGKSYTDLVEKQTKANTVYMHDSSAVKGGYNSVNKLKIEKKDDGYHLSINGTEVLVTNPERPSNATEGVMAFFSVGKKDQEKFPEKPVSVTYRITDSQAAE